MKTPNTIHSALENGMKEICGDAFNPEIIEKTGQHVEDFLRNKITSFLLRESAVITRTYDTHKLVLDIMEAIGIAKIAEPYDPDLTIEEDGTWKDREE